MSASAARRAVSGRCVTDRLQGKGHGAGLDLQRGQPAFAVIGNGAARYRVRVVPSRQQIKGQHLADRQAGRWRRVLDKHQAKRSLLARRGYAETGANGSTAPTPAPAPELATVPVAQRPGGTVIDADFPDGIDGSVTEGQMRAQGIAIANGLGT